MSKASKKPIKIILKVIKWY